MGALTGVRVLISAAAARMGGARAHLLGLVPEFAALAPEDHVLLIAQPDLIAELPALPSTWTVRADRSQERGPFKQLIWEQRMLPRVATRWRADVLLSFGSFLPLGASCSTVLEAGNALPFTRAYWQLIEKSPVRVQVQEGLRWLLLRASLRAATRILVPTRAMRQDVVARLPEVGNRIDVALWGVASFFHHLRWSEPGSTDSVVFGVSKHGINKEFDVLVRAVARLDARLVMTGTPEESRWSRESAALAERLGVGDRVCFAGDLPNRSVADLIQQSRLLVFPTWCESFGLPLAEALAMGAPAVAGNIPACREVGGDAARYYTPGDPTSLCDAISELLADRMAASDLAQAARERGAHFQWRRNAEEVYATLQRAAAA
ncbi:MAG: glycosyltransferase family 4 protein [Chloroflexi bacterium]|nr:glycosyltransferase family 4 protein [Chloroflexota bacterium]